MHRIGAVCGGGTKGRPTDAEAIRVKRKVEDGLIDVGGPNEAEII